MSLTSRKPLPMVIESAGIRYDGSSDYVELLNHMTGEWVQWEKSGVMIKPSVITVTTTNLNGESVTCSINGESYSSVFVGGSASFTVLAEGVATITCGSYTQTVNVTSGSNYNVDITRPPATLTITTSDLNGQTVNITIAGTTYTRVFVGGQVVITLYDVGTATIICGHATSSLNVESGGSYNVTLNRPQCLIELNSTTLQGEPVTVEVGGNTYTGTFSSSGTCNIVVYDVFGTATITSTNASTTQEVTSGNTYSVTLNRPKAIIHLTTSNLQNQTISFSVNGGETNQAAFGGDGTLTLTVYVFGTYTFTCSETTVTQEVASGEEYTVDITEITRVYFVENGVTKNGAVTDSSGDLSVTLKTGYIAVVAVGYNVDYLKIPKNDLFVGKTLTIEFADVSHSPTKSRYRYGYTSNKLYIDFTGSDKIHSFVLTEEMFTNGFEENHYIGVGQPRTSGSAYAELRVVNIYIE